MLVSDEVDAFKLLTVAHGKIDRSEPAPTGAAALEWIASHENARAQDFQRQARQEKVATLRIRLDFDDPKVWIDLDGTQVDMNLSELYFGAEGPGLLRLRELLQRLPEDMRLLVARDAFAQIKGDSLSLKLHKLLISAEWNKRAVFFDDMSEITLNNIRTLPRIRQGSDLALLSDPTSFTVDDAGAVRRLEDKVKNTLHVIPGATPDRVTTEKPNASNIVVLIGHKDEALRQYVRTLAESGFLRDKLLVFFTCYEPMDPAFNSEMIRRSGAKGFVFFSTEIDIRAVEYVMLAANNLLTTGLTTELSARELIELSIDSALTLARDPEMQEQLRILRLHMLMQVSQRGDFSRPRQWGQQALG